MLPKLRYFNVNKTAVRYLSAGVSEPVLKKGGIKNEEIEWSKAKPYSALPGPKPLPILGNTWRFLPLIGEYYGIEQHKLGSMQHKQYGHIYKLGGLFGVPEMVFINNPDDIATLFRNDGPWPKRNAVTQFLHFQKTRGKNFLTDGYGGIFTLDGPEWQEGRSAMNPVLMQTKTVKTYVEPLEKAADKLITRVRLLSSQSPIQEMPENFNFEIHKWALESVTLVALNIDLGLLDPDMKKNSRSHEFISNVMEIFDLLFYLEFRPGFSKYFETPKFKRLMDLMYKNYTYITEQMEKAVEIAKNDGKPDEPTIIKRLLKMDKKYLFGTVADMLGAGVDTTSRSISSVLYFLARNPDVQNKLRNELLTTLPTLDSHITSQKLEEMPYLRAVIKETLRLSPIGAGNVRTTQKDLVLAGYQIPKNTMVLTSNLDLCTKEEYFPEPEKFLPERWLRKDGVRENYVNPWVYMPFGFGARSCIGKRIANLEIEVLISKMIRNFEVEWHHPPAKFTSTLLFGIGDPLRYTMKPIDK